jgi:hypothetical protein
MNPGTRYGWFSIALVCLALGFVSRQAGAVVPDLEGAAAAADIGVNGFRTLVPIHRFWSPVTGRHFYTIDEAERDRLIDEYATVWTYEGISYYTYAHNSEPGLMPVYRFWSPVTGGHFYTIDEAERDLLIRDYAQVWTFEGIAFHAYSPGGQPAQTRAVYRFWSPVTAAHFYTIDEAERNTLVDGYPDVWTPEGVAWYAYPDPEGVGSAPSASGPFEFSGGTANVSCTLDLKAYVNGVEAAIDDSRMTFVPQNAYLRMAVDFGALTTTIEEVLIESRPLEHVTTIRGGGLTIPLTVSGSMIFWGATPRGPYSVSSLGLTFPGSRTTLNGDNETFTLSGSTTVDGTQFTTGQVVRATRFSEGQGVFDDAQTPDQLSVDMVEPFQWSRSQREDRLLQATVRGSPLQLYIVAAQIKTTGVWQGERSQ